VLGDCTQAEIDLQSISPTETKIAFKIYPINPVGQVLQFGARKGVPRKVMTWFFTHTEHRLKSE